MCVRSAHRVCFTRTILWLLPNDSAISTFSGNFRELIEYLNGSTELLSKNGNILDNVLETLDIQQHSLGVLYILVAKFSNVTVSLPAKGL